MKSYCISRWRYCKHNNKHSAGYTSLLGCTFTYSADRHPVPREVEVGADPGMLPRSWTGDMPDASKITSGKFFFFFLASTSCFSATLAMQLSLRKSPRPAPSPSAHVQPSRSFESRSGVPDAMPVFRGHEQALSRL